MTLTAGTQLGPYRIEALLGAGGMGEVYKARDTRLDRTVAIKVLPAQFANAPQFRERFNCVRVQRLGPFRGVRPTVSRSRCSFPNFYEWRGAGSMAPRRHGTLLHCGGWSGDGRSNSVCLQPSDSRSGRAGPAVRHTDWRRSLPPRLAGLCCFFGWPALLDGNVQGRTNLADHGRPQLASSAGNARKAMNVLPVVRPWTKRIKPMNL